MKYLRNKGQTKEQYEKLAQEWDKKLRRSGLKDSEHRMYSGNHVEVSKFFTYHSNPAGANWTKATHFRYARLFLCHAGKYWRRQLKDTYITCYMLDLHVNDGLKYSEITVKCLQKIKAAKRRRRNAAQTNRLKWNVTYNYNLWYISDRLNHAFAIINRWVNSNPAALADDDMTGSIPYV